MITVVFEVWPAEGRREEYLRLAAEMRAEVEKIEGFVAVERFESLTEPGKLLSLSTFRDEAALDAWRATAKHRIMQARGRGGVFADYRLRVARVMRDYGMSERDEAPADSRAIHDRGDAAAGR